MLEFGLLRRFHPLTSGRLAASAHPMAAVCLMVFGGPAAYAFAVLHGAGNGILTIAKGTQPLALFGVAGYGARLGWLNAPARVLQAAAPPDLRRGACSLGAARDLADRRGWPACNGGAVYAEAELSHRASGHRRLSRRKPLTQG